MSRERNLGADPEPPFAPRLVPEAPLIYIVDDKPANAELVAAYLEPYGYQTRSFHDAEAAYAAFSSSARRPSLLISDFAMPKMDGLQLMRRCKRQQPNLKVVLLTGSLDKHLLQGAGLGVDMALDKPLSQDKLLAAVEALIGRGRVA